MDHKKYAVFTMDVETFGDTECIKSAGIPVTETLMDGFGEYIKILDHYGIKSTLFTLAELAPAMADQLRTCRDQGHELALHGYDHVTPMSLTPEQFRQTMTRSKAQMQALFGEDVKGYRAPCFSIDRQRLEILRELGFSYDSSCLGFEPARHAVPLDLQGFSRTESGVYRSEDFCEFPICKGRFFGKPFPISGGGYIRLLPWDMTRVLLRRYIRNHNYYVFYLHPFELTRQAVPKLSKLKGYDKFYIRWGIRRYEKRIRWLIKLLQKEGFRFVTFSQLADKCREKE